MGAWNDVEVTWTSFRMVGVCFDNSLFNETPLQTRTGNTIITSLAGAAASSKATLVM